MIPDQFMLLSSATFAVHRRDWLTRKHGSDHARCLEESYPLSHLGSLVPTADDVLRTAICRGFGYALEEPHGGKLAEIVAGGTDHGQEGPDNRHQRKPDTGRNLLNDNRMGSLANDICNLRELPSSTYWEGHQGRVWALTTDGKTGDENIVLVTGDVDIFLHSGYIGIC